MANMPTHQKQMRRREAEHAIRFITFSCYQRLPLLQNDAIKTLFFDRLAWSGAQREFRLFAWVVMPEHVHLLLQPQPEVADAAQLLVHLKVGFAKVVLARWRASGTCGS